MTLKQKYESENKLEKYETAKKFYENYFFKNNNIKSKINLSWLSDKQDIEFYNNVDVMELYLEYLQDFEYENKVIKNLVDDEIFKSDLAISILEKVLCNQYNQIEVYTFMILYVSNHYFNKEVSELDYEEQTLIFEFLLNVIKAHRDEILICSQIAEEIESEEITLKQATSKWLKLNKEQLYEDYVDCNCGKFYCNCEDESYEDYMLFNGKSLIIDSFKNEYDLDDLFDSDEFKDEDDVNDFFDFSFDD